MANAASCIWRVRPSGVNTNGGGFDPAIGTLNTTLNGAITNSATTVVVASATGWPSSGNYYARIGVGIGVTGDSEVVLVTAGQGTTSWTVTRGQLGTTGTAFATGTRVDTELSRCNTAIAAASLGTSTNSTTFTDIGGAFNETYVGNMLRIASGAGATVSSYTIASVTNATTLVLDRVSGTYTAGVWKVGGGWADFFTNTVSAGGSLVAGNTTYILGSGIPNSASYTYDYTISALFAPIVGNQTTGGLMHWKGDPCTPNYATGGKPCIRAQIGMVFNQVGGQYLEDLYFVGASPNDHGAGYGVFNGGTAGALSYIINVTLDQFGFDVGLCGGPTSYDFTTILTGCRVYDSTASTGGTNFGVYLAGTGSQIRFCNISKCKGPGVKTLGLTQIEFNIISKNNGDGIAISGNSNRWSNNIIGNTIDANTGHGVVIVDQLAVNNTVCKNNIISNHTTSGKYPITCSAGTLAQNDRVKGVIDYNVFYNDLNAPNAISYGAHDTSGGANPYVDQANDDYTLTSTYKNTGYPQMNFPGY